MSQTERKKVVVIGGGFAGLTAAAAAAKKHDVTIVNRRPSFEFLPHIHELVSGLKTPELLRLDLAKAASRIDATFLHDTVTRVAPKERTVVTTSARLPYDALIVAAGGEATASGVPGVPEHAHFLKSVDEGVRIRSKLKVLAGMNRSARVTVVGGGAVGVEVLGELLRAYRKTKIQLVLIESAPRLLKGTPEILDRRIRKLAAKKDVEIHVDARVAAVEPGRIQLTSGRSLASDLTIWTTGAVVPAFLRESGLVLDKAAWVPTQATLQSIAHPDIFVAGDAAAFPEPIDKLGVAALEMGAFAGRNARRYLAGRPLKLFERDKGVYVISFGDLSTFLVRDHDVVIEAAAVSLFREIAFQHYMQLLEGAKGEKRIRKLVARLNDSIDASGSIRMGLDDYLPWTKARVWAKD